MSIRQCTLKAYELIGERAYIALQNVRFMCLGDLVFGIQNTFIIILILYDQKKKEVDEISKLF